MIVQRVLAAIAAFFLVMAGALVAYGARGLSMEFALRRMNRTLVDSLYAGVTNTFGMWAWTELVQPVLVRPAWVSCASLGVILMGIVFTLSFKTDPRRRKRG